MDEAWWKGLEGVITGTITTFCAGIALIVTAWMRQRKEVVPSVEIGRTEGLKDALEKSFPVGDKWMDERALKMLTEIDESLKAMLRLWKKSIEGDEKFHVDSPALAREIRELKQTISDLRQKT